MMMKRKRTALVLLGMIFSSLLHNINAQTPGSIAHIDAFFQSTSNDLSVTAGFFHEKAQIKTITYDENGESIINLLQPSEYVTELQKLNTTYAVNQEAVVLIARGYGALATYFFSVYTRLQDRSTGNNLVLKSVQTAHLVFDKGWKISHLSVQNENPFSPLSADLWPSALTKALYADTLTNNLLIAVDTTPYDPSKIYNPAEVDLAPTYPGNKEVFESLLAAFKVRTDAAEGFSPFTIIIEEDGQAVMHYAGDLSGKQIKQAQSFVNSMLLWYPALKDKASVKCKLILYINE